MNGINSFYYMKIITNKKNIRNNFMFYLNSNDNNMLTTIHDIIYLLLIDQDNVNKEDYRDEDYQIIQPLIDEFLEDNNKDIELSKSQVQYYLNLALNKKISKKYNEELMVKFAEIYNISCTNELNKIDIDILREACNI